MNVAFLELCKELYELSGWDDTYLDWCSQGSGAWEVANGRPELPAYDLGYLMRKLPRWFKADASFLGKPQGYQTEYRPKLELYNEAEWVAYGSPMSNVSSFGWSVADTPEDAACKLAIELFKQGILTNPTAVAESKEEK